MRSGGVLRAGVWPLRFVQFNAMSWSIFSYSLRRDRQSLEVEKTPGEICEIPVSGSAPSIVTDCRPTGRNVIGFFAVPELAGMTVSW